MYATTHTVAICGVSGHIAHAYVHTLGRWWISNRLSHSLAGSSLKPQTVAQCRCVHISFVCRVSSEHTSRVCNIVLQRMHSVPRHTCICSLSHSPFGCNPATGRKTEFISIKIAFEIQMSRLSYLAFGLYEGGRTTT